MLVMAVWFAIKEYRDDINKRRAFAVVSDLGGRIGSIPCWPLGDEIRVEFHGKQFSKEELNRLDALNPLTSRHTIGILFVDTNLTRDDIIKVRHLLPRCVLIRVVNGTQQLE